MKGDGFVEAASEVGRAPKLGLHREVLTFEVGFEVSSQINYLISADKSYFRSRSGTYLES